MPPEVSIRIDGRDLRVCAGISVAAALLGAGVDHTRRAHDASRRSVFCGMGLCFECRVRIDGAEALACLTRVADGMDVSTDA